MTSYCSAPTTPIRGSRRLLSFFATTLLKDDSGDVREQAARGLATASRRGDEGYLLDALGHADVAVRSWAADGLSRLGDTRALPVLDAHPAVGRLKALGEIELELLGRPLERALNRRLRPLKPTMCKCEADAEHPGDKRKE